MTTLSLPVTLQPCGSQGEWYVPMTIGTTQLDAVLDTGFGALLTVQNVSNIVTYKKRSQVATLTVPNVPLGLNCSLQCTDQQNSACFYSQDKVCELHFGTGDLKYMPVLEAIQMGSMKHPAFYIALAEEEENFPFPISTIMGISHYKYSDSSPLGSLCAKGQDGVLINSVTTIFQLFQHLGGGNCLVDTQTIRIAFDDKDKSVSFAVPVPRAPYVPMITSMLPFYAVTLTSMQVGAVKKTFTSPQVILFDTGTSSGGSLAPEVYDFLGSTLVRYTNGLSGLSINDAQVQGVQKNKLGLFPPIAFQWGSFTHVMEPTIYMIEETCDQPSFINVFSRGSDNISVFGNLCFQRLAVTFDLLRDNVYFERLSGPSEIDRNYPSPAGATSPVGALSGSVQDTTATATIMAASIQSGESVALPAPRVRRGIPQSLLTKMAAVSLNEDTFGSSLVNNQCCLYNEASRQKQNVGSLAVTAEAQTPENVWSPRNIVLVALIGAVFAVGVWALSKYILLSKKQKQTI